jgi:hypothetical protein
MILQVLPPVNGHLDRVAASPPINAHLDHVVASPNEC